MIRFRERSLYFSQKISDHMLSILQQHGFVGGVQGCSLDLSPTELLPVGFFYIKLRSNWLFSLFLKHYSLKKHFFCFPVIVLDMASVFEEHHLCHNSSQLTSEQFCNAEGIYVLDENKFIFNKVLVGRTAKARFRITNKSKVHCGLNMGIRCVGPKVRLSKLSLITWINEFRSQKMKKHGMCLLTDISKCGGV